MANSSSDFASEIARAIDEVKNDREHGASWLARRSADILGSICTPGAGEFSDHERLLAVKDAARALAAARPSMAALANSVARINAAIDSLPYQDEAASRERLGQACQAAEQVRSSWASASSTIFDWVRPLLGNTLYTHSRSGTVEYALIRLIQERGAGGVNAIVSESHPGNEGTRLAAALAQAGIEVLLVADAACGLFIGQADALVIGADSVRADGSVVNKVGTLPLALVAREANVPVYVLCETLKIAAPDVALTLEEMETEELLPTPAAGVTVRNIYFDYTPQSLIREIITEQGILTPGDIAAIAGRAEKTLALLHR